MDSNSPKPKINFIFLYGKGGAGKDTEGDLLVKEIPNSVSVSTGDKIREAQDPNNEFHYLIEPYLDLIRDGKLLPDDVVMNLERPHASIFPTFIQRELQSGKTTIISTGFPRKLLQFELFDEYLESLTDQYEISQSHVWLDVNDDTIRERVARRVESFIKEGRIPRHDDNPEIVAERLKTFRENTLPVINRLIEEDRLIHIRAGGTIGEVHEIVEEALGLRPALEIQKEGFGPRMERI